MTGIDKGIIFITMMRDMLKNLLTLELSIG